MPLEKMEHVTIDTDDVEATKAFYCGLLGMADGYRPDLGFEGCWLYVGDTACIHVCEWESFKGYAEARGIPMSSKADGTGALDHVAFNATDYAAIVAKLEAQGVRYAKSYIPDVPLRQLFLKDPNGLIIELNFRES